MRIPFYSCEQGYCAEETSYPADMLREYHGELWCQYCWEAAPIVWLDDAQEEALNFGDLDRFIPEDTRRIQELEQRIKIYRNALDFYANPDNYHALMILADPPCGDFIRDVSMADDWTEFPYAREMPGKLAREALEAGK